MLSLPNVDNAILAEGNGKEARLLVICSLSTFTSFSSHMVLLKVLMCVSRNARDVSFARGCQLYCFCLFSHTTILNIIVVTRREIFNILCQIDGYTKTYSKVNSFAKHVWTGHQILTLPKSKRH